MTDYQYEQCSPAFEQNDAFACCPEGKSRGLTALLAILLGGLGIHYFYLGKPVAGIITILATVITCGLFNVLIFIQGIVMFCMDNHEFRNKYILTRSGFPLY